jgi:hypothetical protein
VSAATIELSGPWTTPVTVTPTGGTNFYVYSSPALGFTAGETLTVTASGATVPAFGPESVVAPPLALLTSPAVSPDGGTTIIPTSADLHITWSGGQAGATMLLKVSDTELAIQSTYMYCTWNASEGQGTVPAAMLKPLSGANEALVYGQYNATSFFAGPYAISLVALPYSGGLVSFQ